MRQLKIYQADMIAGILTEHNHSHYTFLYDNQYLQQGRHGLSPVMPARQEQYESEHLFPIFANMLPEGANRRTICRMKHIDEQDEMGLLMAFAGKDFIGDIHVEHV